jgi:hypothetical protein
VDPAALHAEVPGVVQRQHGGLAEVLPEQVPLVDAVDPDHLHALVDAVEQQLGAGDPVNSGQ